MLSARCRSRSRCRCCRGCGGDGRRQSQCQASWAWSGAEHRRPSHRRSAPNLRTAPQLHQGFCMYFHFARKGEVWDQPDGMAPKLLIAVFIHDFVLHRWRRSRTRRVEVSRGTLRSNTRKQRLQLVRPAQPEKTQSPQALETLKPLSFCLKR